MITVLRDEACILWASGWLAFRCKVAKVFSVLNFNFQVPVEGEAEESDSDNEADPVVFSNAPSSVPLPGEPNIEAPAAVGSPTSAASDLHGLEVRVTKAAQSPASNI